MQVCLVRNCYQELSNVCIYGPIPDVSMYVDILCFVWKQIRMLYCLGIYYEGLTDPNSSSMAISPKIYQEKIFIIFLF